MSISTQDRGGLLYGLAAYGCWGVVPLLFLARQRRFAAGNSGSSHRLVRRCHCPDLDTLAALVRLADQSGVRGALCVLLFISAVLVAFNWLVYIHGVGSKRVMQTSLGYFINPLFSVVLGMVFFRERLRFWQWVALGLATIGLVYLILMVGELPWIALVLASTFSLYGLVRKIAAVDGLIGLAIETMLLARRRWWDC